VVSLLSRGFGYADIELFLVELPGALHLALPAGSAGAGFPFPVVLFSLAPGETEIMELLRRSPPPEEIEGRQWEVVARGAHDSPSLRIVLYAAPFPLFSITIVTAR